MIWFVIGIAVGLWIGFWIGHIDGREKAYRYELKRFRGYTRRAESILAQAQRLK